MTAVKKIFKEFFIIILMIILFMIPDIVKIVKAISIAGIESLKDGNMPSVPLQGADTIFPMIASILVIIIFIYLAKKLGIQKLDFSFINKKNLITILLGFLALRAIAHIGTAILNLQGMNTSANDQALIKVYKGYSWYLVIVSMTIFPAIVEEILFRGYIVGRLFKNKKIIGIIVSALLFGAVHTPTNITSYAMYSLMGAVMGILYYKTGRLEVAIGAHFLNNFIGIIGMF
ncbi:CPBP family intramembrane glutamic endopeptidase [Peptostreptococcus faecalis]|uniref:CPBP family intramembrane glutamic endopeptidase n=1 Tax=Peptostreptococcus faecalis TaxID=2045015 RepID=UPI000C7BA29D|nr:CPBP family intramembrane glutamic endopeptidase [Peptostreptococcus faecalis]